MERILEPEYMDTEEEASSYDAMDHSQANTAVVADLVASGAARGQLLDLGTGPGDIPILLVQKAPQVTEVIAVDAAETMLTRARDKVRAAGVSGRVRLERADVKALPYQDSRFDCVFSNTILHHIPEPADMLREGWRVLAPEGTLWIRDLFRPHSRAAAQALVDRHCSSGTETQRKLLFDSLHAALTLEEARQLVNACGIPGAVVAMSSDRHYTIVARKTEDG